MIKTLLIILLWSLAAWFAIWGTKAQAASEWQFICDGQVIRFEYNSLTIDDQKTFRMLRSGEASIEKKDGRTIPGTVYEFEKGYLLITSSIEPDSAALINGEDATLCTRW